MPKLCYISIQPLYRWLISNLNSEAISYLINCFLEFVHCSILEYGFILTMELFNYLQYVKYNFVTSGVFKCSSLTLAPFLSPDLTPHFFNSLIIKPFVSIIILLMYYVFCNANMYCGISTMVRNVLL